MKFQTIDEVAFINDNGISLDMVSHDEIYENLVLNGRQPIMANDFKDEFSDRRVAEAMNELIRTHYGTDELDTIPSCDKGCTSGGYNEGKICRKCNTEVRRVVDRPLESQIWVRPPRGIPAFISPKFWNIFETYFKSSKFSLLEYLTSESYVPGGRGDTNKSDDSNVRSIITALEKANIKRGMRYFYENFDYIMDVVLRPKPFLRHKNNASTSKEMKADICAMFRALIKEYRGSIFSHRLPFPSKLIMVSEESSGVGYIDKNMSIIFDALKSIVMLERPAVPISARTVETKTVRANKGFAQYYVSYRRNVHGTKSGMARRQQGSTRSPMSGRAVIAPISMAHEYDELHTPWGWSISLMRVMIVNKLLRMGFTPQECFLFADKCIVNSDGPDGDLMEDIFATLIDESPAGGIEVGMLRNPTLERLSDQLFRITKVLRDTNVNAILMSVLAIKGPNADFDGDQLQVKLLIDGVEREQFSRLRSHLGIMDTDSPRKVNGIITLHPELISMANNFLDSYRFATRLTEEDANIEIEFVEMA